METILITLPDGRLARQYNFGYSTLSTFTSSLSASSQVKKQEGTLNNFLLEEGDEEENEDDISTDVTSVAWGASVSGGNPAPSGEEPVEEDAEGPALIVEHGGNGSSIDFGGNINYSDNFSKNFGLNLSAIVPEGESVDDAVVTGTGAFGVSTGYAQGGGSQLGIQVQASSGNPTVGDSGHEYISFNSTSNGNQSADFSFDIDFEITGEDETSTSDNTTDGNTTSSQGTDTTAYSASTTNPDGTSSDNTTDPVDPPAPNFEFTYSTGNGEGGGSVLLYSKSSTIQSPAMTGGGSMSVTNTETLTASETFSAGFSFDFGVLGGITIGVQSSGSGTLEYKSVSVTEHGLPDFNQPTEWYGSWHYPELRNELTVTNTGSFNANVTITFGLLSGLGVDASYSADYTTAVKNLRRTDWAYWETDSDGVNTYKELGHVQTVTTVTTTFSGNLTDGFDAEVTDGWAFSGDIVFEGEKHSGPPPEIEDDSWLNPTTILDGVQLALDIGGLVPGLGEPLDAINAGISLGRGNYAEAALSIAAMLPIGGQAATGAKLANKAGNAVIKNLDKADEAVAGLSKVGDEFKEAVQNLSCFPAGTLVNTATGRRPIESIALGDKVWAFDLLSAEWSLQRVMRTFVRDYDHDAVVVTVNGEEITTTQLHPFWVMAGEGLADRPVRDHLFAPPENSQLEGRWVDAIDLRAGDTLFLQGTGPTRIAAVRTETANYPVYNFSVDNLKCYAVGSCSILVHNSNGLELPGPKVPDSSLATPSWVKSPGGFVSWMKNIEKSRPDLTASQVDDLVAQARSFGLKVEASATDIIGHVGTEWPIPHIHIGDARIHIPVPPGYVIP